VGRPPALPAEEKLRIVMDILESRTTIVQAAREHHVSETSISNWRRQFIEAGCVGLAPGRSAESSQRAAELEAENQQLRTALDEAMVLLRVWRMSAESRLGPSATSR
jgi:transposase